MSAVDPRLLHNQCRGAMSAPVAVLCLALLLPLWAMAQEDGVLSAHEAWERHLERDLVIIDVRTPYEWRESGTPPDAARVSLYSSWGVPNLDFVNEVLAAAGGDRTRPIALICAGGVRSSYAASLLRDRGFTNVSDIAEGMTGSEAGMGWLSRALPVADCGDCPPT